MHIESLTGNQMRVETISMAKGCQREKIMQLRLQVKTVFLNEKTCKISFQDIGFGEFFPATDFYEEKEIHLGGNDGQFNSLL